MSVHGRNRSTTLGFQPITAATNVPIVGNNTTVIVQTVQMAVTTKQSQDIELKRAAPSHALWLLLAGVCITSGTVWLTRRT